MQIELRKYGWDVLTVVQFRRAWCIICTKARWHEYHKGIGLCLACCEQSETEAEQPPFQIERFVKEQGGIND